MLVLLVDALDLLALVSVSRHAAVRRARHARARNGDARVRDDDTRSCW